MPTAPLSISLFAFLACRYLLLPSWLSCQPTYCAYSCSNARNARHNAAAGETGFRSPLCSTQRPNPNSSGCDHGYHDHYQRNPKNRSATHCTHGTYYVYEVIWKPREVRSAGDASSATPQKVPRHQPSKRTHGAIIVMGHGLPTAQCVGAQQAPGVSTPTSKQLEKPIAQMQHHKAQPPSPKRPGRKDTHLTNPNSKASGAD